MDESDSDSDDDQSVLEEEQHLQLTSLLEHARKDELPLRTRNKLKEFVAELLTKTKDDIHEMICANNSEDDDYQGLDSSRDTEAQVETAIRFFPEVISQPYVEGGVEAYPIQRLCLTNGNKCNEKAASFIALLARLAIDFQSFEDNKRGGLLIEDKDGDNTFKNLIYNYRTHPYQNDVNLALMIRLRRMSLFKKNDIRDYKLVSFLCCRNDLSERGFQFMVEWDPTSLLQTDGDGHWLPLHIVSQTSIRGFRIAFGYGICYYPFQRGIRLLFQKDNEGDTPFQLACQNYGRDEVINVVDEVLARYAQDTPLNSVEALLVAAVDENIHFDCVFLLLRREPDLLVGLLPGFMTGNNNDGVDVDDDDDDDDGDDDDDDDDDGGDSNVLLRKRKRGKKKNKRKKKKPKRKRKKQKKRKRKEELTEVAVSADE